MKYKMKYRPRKRVPITPTTNDAFERKAREYALWLLQRDGKHVPSDRLHRCEWSHVYVNGKRERRIRAVQFAGSDYLVLPNWDWVPTVQEETDLDIAA